MIYVDVEQKNLMIATHIFGLHFEKAKVSTGYTVNGKAMELPNYYRDIASAMKLALKANISIISSKDGLYIVATTNIVNTCDKYPNIAKELHGKYWVHIEDISDLSSTICKIALAKYGFLTEEDAGIINNTVIRKQTGLYTGISSPMKCIYGKRYEILGVEDNNTYRVIDESGEDYLYSMQHFIHIRYEEMGDK